MFGKCKACEAKDAHIADLKVEIKHLRSLTFPTQAQQSLPVLTIEANKVLDADQEITEVSADAETEEERLAIQEEADRLLNASY